MTLSADSESRKGNWLKIAAAAVGVLSLSFLGIWLFSAIWVRVGLISAMLILFGVLLFIGWRVDRRDSARRAGLPPV